MTSPSPVPHIERLDLETQATWNTLAALRSGAMAREFAERIIDVVNAVIDMHQVTDNGKVTGPAGTIQLTLTVSPSQENPKETVTFVDKIAYKRPEDRAHTVFVGRGGTVHARPQDENRYRQMSLIKNDELAPSLIPPDDEEAGEDRGRQPYRD
jgi:hypothetical protein